MWCVERRRTTHGARTSCSGCDLDDRYCRTCPVEHGDVPDGADHALFLLTLYQRCRHYGHLPAAGGLLDQEDVLMASLDIAAEMVAVDEEREQKAAQDRERAWSRARSGR